MKKATKIFSVIIAAAMVLGVMCFPAFAAGDDWTGAEDTTVRVGTDYYNTLAEALTAVYKNSPSDTVIIECKENSDVGSMTHAIVADSIHIIGNNARVTGGERDMGIDTYKYDRTTGARDENGEFLTKDITVIVDELDGIAAWGQRNTTHTINLEFNDCDGMNRVYFSGTAGTNNITLNNCDFSGDTANNCTVYSSMAGEITLNNCTFTGVGEPVNINTKAEGAEVAINVNGCTFTDCGQGNAGDRAWAAPIRVVKSAESAASTLHVDADTIFAYSEGVSSANGDVLIGNGRSDGNPSYDVTVNVLADAEVQYQEPGYYAKDDGTLSVVRIGLKGYATLQDAVKAAVPGDTIEIIAEQVSGSSQEIVVDKAVTITSAEGQTAEIRDAKFVLKASAVFDGLKITGNSYINVNDAGAAEVTIQNCDVNVELKEKVSGRAAFIVSQSEVATPVKLAVKNNVIIVKSTADSYPAAMFTWRYLADGSEISGNTFGSEAKRYNFIAVKSLNAADDAVITISDNTVYGTNRNFYFYAFDLYQNNSRLNTYTVLSKNNTVLAEEYAGSSYTVRAFCIEVNDLNGVSGNAVFYDNGTMMNGVPVTLNDIEFSTDRGTDAVPYVNAGVNVLLDENGKVKAGNFVAAVAPAYAAPGLVLKENADGSYSAIADSALTNAVAVVFEKVDETDDTLYNIVLKAADNTIINRLTAAELAFKLESEEVAYEILPYGDVRCVSNTQTEMDNDYLFYLKGAGENGEDVPDITQPEIVIAQVQFNGYGAVKFSIDDSALNAVRATANADNIVTDYLVGGGTDANVGELIINDTANNGVIETELSPVTADLTVKIAFNNNVTAGNAEAYQQMKVTITGADGKEYVYALGGDNYTAEEAVIVAGNLPANNRYTVTVSGEGYRTAKKTVQLTEAGAELAFWNNVKDTAEANGERKNFLAGEIVKDGKINIYDLSAVVSYFGEIDLDNGEKNEYAKYDLNRDGKVDSKDVAMVLVSWNE